MIFSAALRTLISVGRAHHLWVNAWLGASGSSGQAAPYALFNTRPRSSAARLTRYSSRLGRTPQPLPHQRFDGCPTCSRESKVRCQVICQLLPSAFCHASFYTAYQERETPCRKRVGGGPAHRVQERKAANMLFALALEDRAKSSGRRAFSHPIPGISCWISREAHAAPGTVQLHAAEL